MEDRLNMLRLVLDELPSGVFLVYGHDARLLLANRATTTICGSTWWSLGQPMEEFLAKSGVGLLDMHEQPLAFEQLATVRAVRHGQTVRQFQSIIRQPIGTTLSVLLNAVALDAQEARVSIRDRGIGIPEKDQARIFGQFARASNAETYGIGGTGLGLYLCHELIEQHNGRIWFESKEGQGTTFFVALPRTCGVTGFESNS